MQISNLSSNVVVISCNFLQADAGTFTGQVALQPGQSFMADSFTPVNAGVSNGVYVDDIIHTYVGVIDATGHQSVEESWSLTTVGFDGFWFGISMCVIPMVIWFARRGAAGGNPWRGDVS